MRPQRWHQAEEKLISPPSSRKQKTRQETPTGSEEEVVKEHSAQSGQPQTEPVHTPQQKLVKRPANDPVNSHPSGSSSTPTIPTKPSAAVISRLKKPKPRPTADSIFAGQPVVLPPVALDVASMSKEKISLQQVLKGNEHKLTCLLNVGGKTYVVKSGPGYSTMEDHLVNTDVFARLGIKGVRVPLSEELTDGFRAALTKQLDSKNPADQLFLKTLGEHDQIATLVRGIGADNVFDSASRAQMKTIMEKISSSKDTESAVLALKGELEKGLSVLTKLQIKQKDPTMLSKLDNPAQRAQAIKDLAGIISTPSSLLTLSWIDRASKQSPVEAGKQLSAEIDTLETAAVGMSEHAKSKAGAYSLGGMSVVDLICGMNDRILGDKFNGGNFMFDPAKKEFWCVDNAKDPKLALSFKNEDSWKNWVVELMTLGEGVTDRGQGIGEHIHWALYTRKTEDTRELSQNIVLDPAAAGATAAGIDEAVADTLRSLQALAKDDTNGLPKTERDKLRSRLAFVDRRMKFAALLKFDPQFSEVPSAKNPWVGKKVGRLLTSAVVGRSDEEKTAEAWKTKARNSQTSDQDLDALDATISTYLTNHPDADQRVLKALFAARSERLLRSLNAKIAVLAVLPQDDKAWGDLAPSVVTGIKAMTDQWVTKLRELDDKAAAVELQEAVTKFASLLPGATPAQ